MSHKNKFESKPIESLNIKETQKKLFQFFLDVKESLSCSFDELIKIDLFQDYDEIKKFINYKENGNNFCLLKKQDLSELVFLIPVGETFLFIPKLYISNLIFSSDFKMFI